MLRAGGGTSGTPLPYAMSAGPQDAYELRRSDVVYVLAHHEWAAARGLDGGAASLVAASWADPDEEEAGERAREAAAQHAAEEREATAAAALAEAERLGVGEEEEEQEEEEEEESDDGIEADNLAADAGLDHAPDDDAESI